MKTVIVRINDNSVVTWNIFENLFSAKRDPHKAQVCQIKMNLGILDGTDISIVLKQKVEEKGEVSKR